MLLMIRDMRYRQMCAHVTDERGDLVGKLLAGR